MKVGRGQLVGEGADGAGRNARSAAQGHAQVGEVAAHPGPVDEGSGRRGLRIRHAMLVIHVFGNPVQDRQNPRPAGGLAELSRHEAAELVRRAVAAGLEIGQHLGRQLAPVVLRHLGRQALQHAVVHQGLIGQGHLARDVTTQSASAEIDILVLIELDRRVEGQAFLQNVLTGPMRDLNLVDGVRRRIETIDELGAHAQFHGGDRSRRKKRERLLNVRRSEPFRATPSLVARLSPGGNRQANTVC